MNTYEKLKNQLNREQMELDSKFKFLNELEDKLTKLELEAMLYSVGIDFDRLTHEQVIKVMVAFQGGKWTKTPNYNGQSIDYELPLLDGNRIRCWAGEPPPSCKIIEVEELVPEHVFPATTRTVRKLQCV